VPEEVTKNTLKGDQTPIFIYKIRNPSSFLQLLNEMLNEEFNLNNINLEKFKIQSKSSIAYTNIVKELKIRNTEFYIYKSKQERSFNVILKYMLLEKNIHVIKKDIVEFGHIVTNIWNTISGNEALKYHLTCSSSN